MPAGSGSFPAARAFATCNCSVESVMPVTSAPVDLGQIEAKAAPARTDVEHAVAAADQQLGGEVTLLGQLGIVEGGVRRLEIGAAILLVGVEEEGIEPPVEIVMMGDVVPRPAAPD